MNKKTDIQAIIFNKLKYTLGETQKYIKEHSYKPIKEVHITGMYYRYRLKNPNLFYRFITKQIKPGIYLILGFYK